MGPLDFFYVTPAEVVKRATKMKGMDKPIGAVLDARAELCSLSTRQGSLGSSCSALMNGCEFAKGVHNYPEDRMLPPQEAAHVKQWIGTFKMSHG